MIYAEFNIQYLQKMLIRLLKKQKIPQPQAMTEYLISSLPAYTNYLHQWLPLLYNSLLMYNVYPADWKRAICVIIPKKGNQPYLISSAYRPISLFPCIAKIMEAILVNQIEKDTLLCGALSPYHMGGIKQTSAIDAVIAILNPISNSLSSTRNAKTIAERYLASPSLLCMDIQGAFNATSTKILANIIHFRNINLNGSEQWAKIVSFSFDDKIEDPQPRVLGITLDSALSFTSHLAQAASAGRQALGSFNFLRTTSLGISTKTAHYIAISAILPKMLYGSQVWWTGSISCLAPILSTYNQIARLITGLPHSTCIKNLLTCANLPPLKAILSHISCNYEIRLLFFLHNHPVAIPTSDDFKAQKLSGTDHVLSQVKGMYTNRLEDRSAPSPIPILLYHTRVHTSRAPDSDITHSTWIKTLPPSSFRLYTDGSKLPSGYLGSGWALDGKAKVGIENTKIASGFCNLGIESEGFDAELHAVHEGLSFLATSDFFSSKSGHLY
jgi:hypothetical protein